MYVAGDHHCAVTAMPKTKIITIPNGSAAAAQLKKKGSKHITTAELTF
jgi:hypothetical protein